MTAEAALALPLLALMALAMVWMVSIGVAHIRVTDAARETARAAARGDTMAEATRLGTAVAGEGSSVRVSTDGDRVVATAATRVRRPGGALGFLPTVTVHAKAVAMAEPTS